MTDPVTDTERYPWAGPALFIIIALLEAWFFWWFVQA
jgi:hypothetical protein